MQNFPLIILQGRKRGYRGFSKSSWLKENEKDLLYGKAQWFMADDKVKEVGKYPLSAQTMLGY